jgi:putative ABC transport system permease protein
MLKHYFEFAWRNIIRHKAHTLINILGLALGTCACIVIFLVSSFELSFDNFHPDKERIYHIGCKEFNYTWKTSRIPPPMPAAIKGEITGIEAITSFYPYDAAIVVTDKDNKPHTFDSRLEGTDQSAIIITDPPYFSIFKYEWLAGNPATSLQQPFQLVLSERRARQYFGSLPYADILGKEVIYEDSLRVTVAGIVKDWDKNTDFPFTDFISFSTINASFLKTSYHADNWLAMRGNPWIFSMIKLSKNTTPAQLSPQLTAFIRRHIPNDPNRKLDVLLQPLSDIHYNTDYSHDDIRKAHLPTLYVLMGTALFILLLAVINFINLSAAHSIQRAKEIGVRKVLGSSRISLVFQFLTETFIVSSFGAIAAVLLAGPVLSFFRDYIPAGVIFHLFNPGTLIFIVLLTLVTSLLAGLYPARLSAAYAPVAVLKGEGAQRGGEKWWLRKALIVFQFSISLLFIIGTLVIGRQVRYMLNTDFGFKTDAVLSVQTNWRDSASKLQVFKEKIKQLPGVADVIQQGGPPAGWGQFGGDILFSGKNPIKLTVCTDWGNEDAPESERNLGIKLATTNKEADQVQATLSAIEKLEKEIYPRDKFRFLFIDKAVAPSYDTEQKTSHLMQAATLITIFISCLGLFGLILFTAQRRTREIGIRKVIGASVADIIALLCKDFLLLVFIAFLIASPVSWFLMNRWLEGFAYRLPVSWWIFAVAGAGAIFIALLTVSFQAIKSATANPIRSLRSE